MEKNPTVKVTLTISGADSYPSFSLDENGKRKQRVAYQVTGSKSAIEQYNADMLANNDGKLSIDDATKNPLFTLPIGASAKALGTGTIVRASKPNDNGQYQWFVDTEEDRVMSDLMKGASPEEQAQYARDKYLEKKAFAKELIANREAKRIAYANSQSATADLSKP